MIDRLIMSSDQNSEYQRIIEDKTKTKLEKDQLRRSYLRRNRWISNITIKKFHSLCYWIIRNYGANEFDNKLRILSEDKRSEEDEFAKHITPETIFDVFQKILISLCENNEYLLDLKRFILVLS